MKNKMIGLNEKQKSVVSCESNKILLIACAGAGKTLTTTRKVGSLLEKRYAPERIYCISFTRAAARELKERLIKVDKLGKDVKTSTFHSFVIEFFQKKYGEFSMIGDSEKETILNTLSKRFNIKSPKKLIDSYKKSLFNNDRNIQYAIDAYIFELKLLKLMDIDILLPWFLRELEEDEEFLLEIRNSIDYLIYDESQDVNDLQNSILEKIIPAGSPIGFMMVGDDDQNIYQWNNTSVEYILRFPKRYNATTLLLNENYRCSNQIIAAANNLISQNKNRFAKKMIGMFDAEDINLESFETETEEILRIIGISNSYITGDRKLAILCRSNKEIKDIYKIFKSLNIDVNTSIKEELNREIIDRLKLIINPANDLLTEKIIGTNKDIKIYALDNKISLFQAYVEHENEIALKMQLLNTALNSSKTAYSMYLLICEKLNMIPDRKVMKAINLWSSRIRTEANNISNFVNYAESKEAQETLKEGNSNISLTTVHASKGLEFDEVIIYNFNNINYSFKGNKEENRRLLYVAITRAKEKLNFFFSNEVNKNGLALRTEISPFIQEIKSENNI